jgi:hypothetical protein
MHSLVFAGTKAAPATEQQEILSYMTDDTNSRQPYSLSSFWPIFVLQKSF